MSRLVIGVGNPARGDDGLGAAVVEALAVDARASGIETGVASGDLSGLVLRWGPDDDVVLVDAMVSRHRPGEVLTLDLSDLSGPDRVLRGGLRSSHGLGLAHVVALARRLDRLPRSFLVVAVEGSRFDHGRSLSPPVAAAVSEVVELLVDREPSAT